VDLRCQRTSKTEVLFALNQLLLQQSQQGRTTVLIVDEAHNLEWEVLEEIRLLGNLENRRGKLIQVILAGQPELDRKLDAPNLRQLKQRIVLRCLLEPFDLAQSTEYVNTRMSKAGMPDQQVIPQVLITEVHVRAQGIPRLINAICDNLLLTCFAMETKVATVAMLDEVSKDMRLEWPGSRPRGQRATRSSIRAATSCHWAPGHTSAVRREENHARDKAVRPYPARV
jgi:type II secretory pathway predicted ATPase ExeA